MVTKKKKGLATLALSRDAMDNAVNAAHEAQDSGAPIQYQGTQNVAYHAVDAAADDIMAAAILVFVNRFDNFTNKISGEGRQALMQLAVREFGVKPEWFWNDDAEEAAKLQWASENPEFGEIPDLTEYDTRPEASLEPRRG